MQTFARETSKRDLLGLKIVSLALQDPWDIKSRKFIFIYVSSKVYPLTGGQKQGGVFKSCMPEGASGVLIVNLSNLICRLKLVTVSTEYS